jgi:hypothetical protein
MIMQDNPEEKTFEISITGDGITISQNVDESTAREIVNILMGGAPGDTKSHSGRVQGRSDTGSRGEPRDEPRRMSLREFLDESRARRNPDKITVIGEYIFEHEGRPEFSRDDIRSRFKQAGEAAPGNFARDFTWAITNGWIAEDTKNPGAYYVTKKGRDAIDARFAPEVKKATTQKPGGRRRSPKRRNGDLFSGNEE